MYREIRARARRSDNHLVSARSIGVRAKHDIEGNHRSEAPACHRCGLPLLADSEYCPFCERWLTEGTVTRILGNRRTRHAQPGERRLAGIPEHTVLMIGAALFALIAIISVVVAITT
jgi:hypothetical protein